jgi:hypothetical protein
MLSMYRKVLEENLLMDDYTPMGFGKYAGKTFLEVKQMCPSYEGFCRDCWESNPDQSRPELVEFGPTEGGPTSVARCNLRLSPELVRGLGSTEGGAEGPSEG